jgi:hypothetical protein
VPPRRLVRIQPGHVTVPVIQTAKGVKKSIVVFDRAAEAYASGKIEI